MARTEARHETDHVSGLDRYFRISERGSTVRTEMIAGVATWLTMAYILFVNPTVLGFLGAHAIWGQPPDPPKAEEK